MSIPDKIAAANKINDLLKGIVANGGLRLKYRITVDPPLAEQRDWERPEIFVEFAGPGLASVAGTWRRAAARHRIPGARNASPAGQRARENLLRLHESSRHAPGRVTPCRRCGRRESAQVGSSIRICAHVIARTPHCPPGSTRSSRTGTQSEGEGMRRYVVVYPENYKPAAARPPRKPSPDTFLEASSDEPVRGRVSGPVKAERRLRPSLLGSPRYNLPVNLDDTIVAIATPPGRGGIGVSALPALKRAASRPPCCA